MNRKEHVLLTIELLKKLHPDLESSCMNGSCFQLYLLLLHFYPTSECWYDAVNIHVVTKIGTHYFDIRGEVQKTDNTFQLIDADTFNRARSWSV